MFTRNLPHIKHGKKQNNNNKTNQACFSWEGWPATSSLSPPTWLPMKLHLLPTWKHHKLFGIDRPFPTLNIEKSPQGIEPSPPFLGTHYMKNPCSHKSLLQQITQKDASEPQGLLLKVPEATEFSLTHFCFSKSALTPISTTLDPPSAF